MLENARLAARLERRLMKRLQHPNIIELEDAYEDGKYICLVMELMANDLRETM